MRRLFGLLVIAVALSLTGVSSFAAMKQQTKQVVLAVTEIKGEVTAMNGHTLFVKDEAGKTHMVKAADLKTLEGIKVGDKVDVKMEHGKAASIQKI